MREIHNTLNISSSIAAQAVTAAVNGASINLTDYDAVEIALNLGAFAGTTPTATIQIQESANNVTFTAVAASDLLGGALPAIDNTNANQVYKRGYIGTKQYIRVAVTAVSGTSPSLPMSATVIRGFARKKPV